MLKSRAESWQLGPERQLVQAPIHAVLCRCYGVSDEDVQAEVQKLATSLQLPVAEIQRMVEAGGQGAQEEFRERMQAEKALQFVYQNAVIQG